MSILEIPGNTAATTQTPSAPSVIICDEDGRIVGTNSAAQEFFGWIGAIPGSLETLLESDARQFASDILAASKRDQLILQRSARVTLRRHDDSLSRVLASASAISILGQSLIAFTFHPESAEVGQAALLRRLIDALPDYLFIKDADNRIVVNNIAHARNLGSSPEACVGKTDREFFPTDLAEKYIAAEKHVTSQGCVFQNEEETVDRKGTRRWVLTTKIPLKGENGAVVGLAGINHDITEMKHAQYALAESEERHRTLYHNTPVMLHSFDPNNIILHVSDYWLNSMGYSNEEVVGRSAFDFYAEPSRRYLTDTVIPHFHKAGRISNVPLECLTRDGRSISVEVSAIAQYDAAGRIASGLAVSIDVTQRRKAEAEREELHRRLLELSRHAGMAEVATGVLHNVGNVLNSVNVSAGLLTDKVKNSPVKKLARAVDLMKQHADDLGAYITSDPQGSQLPNYFNTVTSVLQTEEIAILEELGVLAKHVDHIKEIVRVQQSVAKLTRIIESVDLAAVIDDALCINTPISGTNQIKIESDFPRPMIVFSDKNALLEILTNLIANAHHALRAAANSDKRITIRAAKTSRAGNERFSIQVTDNGIGIDPHNLTRIFNHGFTTKANGHGFGLHSSANTAKRLGGTLEAASPGPGTGATFTLSLPSCKEVITP